MSTHVSAGMDHVFDFHAGDISSKVYTHRSDTCGVWYVYDWENSMSVYVHVYARVDVVHIVRISHRKSHFVRNLLLMEKYVIRNPSHDGHKHESHRYNRIKPMIFNVIFTNPVESYYTFWVCVVSDCGYV